MVDTAADKGLEGVVAGSSAICTVDGLKGELIYRGYDIHDLAQGSTFEEVVHLLWHGDLPSRAELETLKRDLGQNMALHPEVLALIKRLPTTQGPQPVLRTAFS